ncbi:MAG: mycofactocin biosynthesis peptidyl-dipeptidase MftE [Actinomycetia bacterium]|nr:mycofactocin biosynthesis peptidyl-dipeptidase MftE [Actinomycetes bacterium]MCP5033411.1 mycofactocin biosynthesis peptidyl-dipeptidase MftE [Actinomycetes bacterium]
MGAATTVEIADARPSLLLVPLGSTEQHGPHLPLDTDSRIAKAWAERLAALHPSAVVAPVVDYGSSGEHQSFPGTLSIGHAALHGLVLELVRSAAHTFSATVFVCGHGGNAVPVLAAVEQARSEGHRATVLLPRWSDLDGIDIDAHAGRTETSILLHLCPDEVRLDLAAAGATEPLSELMDDLATAGMEAVSASGVLGDPTGASPAEGARLLDDLVARSRSSIADLWP